MIERRPYIAVRELYATASIKARQIEPAVAKGRVCMTPLTLPPPAPDICRSSSQVDVNGPDAKRLLTPLVGVDRAIKIAESQPHLKITNLAKVRTLTGLPKRVIAKLCATPPPIDLADGTRYTWMYSDEQSQAVIGEYRLDVAPGTIAETVGAWASITPLPDNPGPRADYHIHGSWSGQVKVTIPRIPSDDLPDGWSAPLVLHDPDAAEGPDLAWASGSAVANADGTVSVMTSTLSIFEETERDESLFFLDPAYEDPFKPEAAARSQIRSRYEPLFRTQPDPMSGCTNTDTVSILGFISGTAITCSYSTSSSGTTFTLKNTRSAAAAVFVDSGGTLGGGDDDDANALMAHILKDYNASADGSADNGYLLLPNAKVDLLVPAGSRARIDLRDALLETSVLFSVEQLTGILDAAGVKIPAIASCFVDIANTRPSDPKFASLLKPAISCAMDEAELIAKGIGSKKWAVAIKGIKKVLLVFEVAGTLSDATSFTGTYILAEHRLLGPTGSGTGGARPNAQGGLDGTLPADKDSIVNAIGRIGEHAYLSVDTPVRRHDGDIVDPHAGYMIGDGGSYQCLAQRYPVADGWIIWRLEFMYPLYHHGDCPQRSVPTNWTNWILRTVDASGVGHGYLLGEDGKTHHIPNGNMYRCLTGKYFVLDWTPKAEVDKFPLGNDATC